MSEATFRDYASPVRTGLVTKYLERYVEGNMTALVVITRGTGTTRTTVYAGRARVHRLANSVQMGFGDEPQYLTSGTISVPNTTDANDAVPVVPRVNDNVRVTRHHDPRLVGRSFRVMSVALGGQFSAEVSLSVLGAVDQPSAIDTPVTTAVRAWPDPDYTADDG